MGQIERGKFLTVDEKRAAVGYSAVEVSDFCAPRTGQTPLLKYSPDQPRVPSGNSDGGQWVDGGGGGSGNDSRVLSDATPDDYWKPGARLPTMISLLATQSISLKKNRFGWSRLLNNMSKSIQIGFGSVFAATRGRLLERGDTSEGLSIGSSKSLEAATKLVNSAISRNSKDGR